MMFPSSLSSGCTIVVVLLWCCSCMLHDVHALTVRPTTSKQRSRRVSSRRLSVKRIQSTLVAVGHTHQRDGMPYSSSPSSSSMRLSSSSTSSSSSSMERNDGGDNDDDDDISTSYSRLVGTSGAGMGGGDASIRLLREKARELREEIELFEQKKNTMEDVERMERQKVLDEQQATIDRYSVTVPILKMDGTTVEEKIQFPPRLTESGTTTSATTTTATTITSSEIILCEAPLPLGILLGEHETLSGMTVVDEVLVGSNGEIAGVKEGDLLRACTACKVEMEQPTWQLIAGGIGRPKTVRFMFSTDYKPFEQVMGAVGSNRMDPEGRSVLLVLERPIPIE